MIPKHAFADRYRRRFRYEEDVHGLTLESLETVPLEAREDERYRKALDLFAHILAARSLWLHRLGVLATGPTTLSPKGRTLAELRREAGEVQGHWREYLAGVKDADLERPMDYTSLEGPRYRNTVEDILTQLFGHSWYHRGQIAALVRGLGGQPAETDFIFWSRLPLRD